MEVIILESAKAVCDLAAQRLKSLLSKKPDAVLGLATGKTPEPFYESLVSMHQQQGLDFSKVTTFNLDEYVGLSPKHPGSYAFYMQQHLLSKVNIDPTNTFLPDGMATDIPEECCRYEGQILERGPIDLQILGIGRDGHIGFNEPMSSFGSRTRIKTLTPETRQDNQQYFDGKESVPKHVITMGIATILEAKEILLIAYGEAKAKAIAAMVEGPLTASLPARALQFHPTVKSLVDEAAASQLKKTEYYRWVFEHKPLWQQLEFK